jgi:1-acyl-sn-glycerol-3-phosphate acyltransferase
VARRRLGFWRRFSVMLVLPILNVWTRRTWTGMENIPATGGVIIVPNHASHFDPLVVAHYIYAAHRWPRFLGKASLWKVPVLGFLLRKVQQIPVERGSVEAVSRPSTAAASW